MRADNRDLVQVLIQDPDPMRRSRAHRELGNRAVAREDLGKALRHYEEAFALDPTDEVARDEVKRLTAQTQPVIPRRSLLHRFVRGLR